MAARPRAYGSWLKLVLSCRVERGESVRLKPRRSVEPPSPCLVTAWLESVSEFFGSRRMVIS